MEKEKAPPPKAERGESGLQDTVAQKARIGTATANRGPKVKVFLRPTLARTMWKALLCMSSGLIGPGEVVSLFLEDWELARVALSCHVALDMLCQEMHTACHSKRKPFSHRGL